MLLLKLPDVHVVFDCLTVLWSITKILVALKVSPCMILIATLWIYLYRRASNTGPVVENEAQCLMTQLTLCIWPCRSPSSGLLR